MRIQNMPADLDPATITAVIDPREQMPFSLVPLKTTGGTLRTGDYSVLGLESSISLERKSLGDLLACCGGERARFGAELQRMLAYPVRAVVVECSWQDIERGDWRSKITPESAIGSILGWMAGGVPFVFAGDRTKADTYAARILFTAARRRWREARLLVGSVIQSQAEAEADHA